MQANYQPVMIKTLLESPDYKADREVIIEKLKEANHYEDKDYTLIAYDVQREVLGKDGRNIVLKDLQTKEYSLDVFELTDNQRKELINICDQKIKEFGNSKSEFNCWIWSVTPENWETVKKKNIWASRIEDKIRTKVRASDKVIFYVQETGQFQGIFEFVGGWYDATEPVWTDEIDSVKYPSQIKLKPLRFGNVAVYDIAPKLKIFSDPTDKRRINLVLKGGGGYPSNNGKPIPYDDYLTIFNSMADTPTKDSINYWKISPGERAEYWQEQLNNGIIAIGWSKLGDLTNISEEELAKRMREKYPEKVANRYQITYFLKIKKGDIILANKGKSTVVGIGRVIGDYKYFPALEYPHTYKVEWFDTKVRQIPTQDNWYVTVQHVSYDLYEQILSGNFTEGDEKISTFEDESLPIPTKDELMEGYKKISDELLIPEEKIIEIVTALASGRHILLAGPIGTGKTELARKIPAVFWEKHGGYYSEDHTATSDWSTQDVIGGIFPKMNQDGKPIYEIQNGCVVETVQKNWLNGVDGGPRRNSENPPKIPPYRGTWLIIDEFNRADIDKAFGQLFTALRTRTLKIPTDTQKTSYKTLKIPQDYRIIGTLNTADKHYLFQLSDALKSRFAYIEIDIPKKEQFEQEIYYAMKNALADLVTNHYEDLIVLDHQAKKINKEQSNSDFYERIYQAYHFLDSVRIFKKLGTAILKLVYQNLLVGTKMTGNSMTALDNALTSTLIPQLENLSQSAIGAIHALYSDSIVKYFQDAYKNPNRQSYVDTFDAVLEYLQVPKTQLVAQFANGNLNVEDNNTWRPIQTAYDAKKKEFELQLDQLKQSMEDLIQTMVI